MVKRHRDCHPQVCAVERVAAMAQRLEREMLLEMDRLIVTLQEHISNKRSDSPEVATTIKGLQDRVEKRRGEYTADLVGFIGRHPDALPAQTFAFAPSGSVEEEAASQILLNQDVDWAWKQVAVGKNGHTEAVSAGRRTRPTARAVLC